MLGCFCKVLSFAICGIAVFEKIDEMYGADDKPFGQARYIFHLCGSYLVRTRPACARRWEPPETVSAPLTMTWAMPWGNCLGSS